MRLRQTIAMRRFAHDRLGLPANGSFSRLAITHRKAVTWNVVVAPEFSLAPRLWCFPVAGCVAYRGYFERQKAANFAHKMEKKAYDVMIAPALAYSTLGWFEDPLLDTMLQYSDANLAGIIFHELAHARLYVKSDTDFNESFAGFVEDTGVRLWLAEAGEADGIQQWQNQTRAAAQFNHLLQESRRQLETVYASGRPKEDMRQAKKHVFDALSEHYLALVETDWNGIDYYVSWMTGDLNNAHLALMESYEGGICAFAALYEQAEHNLDRFYALAGEKAALDRKRRQDWLHQPCKPIASAGDL